MKEVYISGTGKYLPENIVTNDDLAKIVDTSDEWITTRTGIKERRISSGEDTSLMATYAAKLALENAGISAEELDFIIVATTTPDNFTPSAACLVQSNLGAAKAAAFDINAACTGFIYALNVATHLLKSGPYKHILVIGAETLSKIVNWKDRNTCVLFGDGAGAIVLSASMKKGVGTIILGSDGQKGEVLQSHALPVINPFIKTNDLQDKNHYVAMDGREVFKFATGVMVDSIEKLLQREEINLSEVKYIVPHQANFRIIDYAAKKLDVDINKFYVNLDKYGNTSSASIPIALDELNKKGLLNKNDNVIMVGFGGGLTFGAALVKWQK